MTKWSETAWREITPIFDRIIEHPFITELTAGTLARDKFIFYLKQDALYLAEFGRALTLIAAKCPKSEDMKTFLTFANDTMEVELALHRSFLGPQGLIADLAPSPACLLYTSFMHRQLLLTPVETAVATVLPCFWIYKEVGDYILSRETTPKNPYQSWISTYGGDEYGQAVKLAIAIADNMAEEATPAVVREMTEAFVVCSKMEWMFWDGAWQMESWPV